MFEKFAVHLSTLAEEELNLIIDGISKDYDEYAAFVVYEKIAQAISSLCHFPERYSFVNQEQLRDLKFRRARAGKYNVIFKVDADKKMVRVEFIAHSHRDMARVYGEHLAKKWG